MVIEGRGGGEQTKQTLLSIMAVLYGLFYDVHIHCQGTYNVISIV